MTTTRMRGTNLIRIGFVGLLLVVLVGLLAGYATIGQSLPLRMMSEREAYLGADARLSSIAQLSPVLNYMSEEGIFEPGIISWRASRVRATLSVQEDESQGNAIPYQLDFRGEYQLTLPDSRLNTVEVIFPFPQNLETLHDVEFLVDGDEPEQVEYSTGGIRWQDEFISNEEHTISIRYRAEGAYTFTYQLPKEQRTDIDVQIRVEGLSGSEIPDASLPAIEIESGNEVETISWEYSNLIDNRNIQIQLPGEQTFPQRIAEVQVELDDLAESAPFLVVATLMALAVSFHLSRIRIKLEIYLLLALGLVLFFPMVTFLSGLVGVPLGSSLALLLTIGLLVLFLNQTVGWDQVGFGTVLVLVVCLGVIGLGRLTEWSGLLITAGGVILLGVFMSGYAHWQKAREELQPVQVLEQAEDPSPATVDGSFPSGQEILHCPQCSHHIEEGVNFCPSCGYETKQLKRCGHCGRDQFPPPDFEVVYCLACGEALS